MTTLAHPPLDDVLAENLQVVFCGTAAGHTSARVGHYYAGPGNQFWATLHGIGLTPRRPYPNEFRQLPRYGIGLTDVCKQAAGNDSDINHSQDDVDGFWQRVSAYRPDLVAFNGKRAAKVALRTDAVSYGLQKPVRDRPRTFVLPSTSGAARGYWDLARWQELARLLCRG
jgi:TDG/mug DNA glycosylase family protein